MSRVLGARVSSRLRVISVGTVSRQRYSLASRIRDLLPNLGEPPFEKGQEYIHQGNESLPMLLKTQRYSQAAHIFTSSTSIDRFEKDFREQILPHTKSQYGTQEIKYCIAQLGLEALVRGADIKAEFLLVNTLEGLEFDARFWDQVIFDSHDIHFPQILWSKSSSVWLKTRILKLIIEKAEPAQATNILRRYIGQLAGAEPISILAKSNFDLVSDVVFQKADRDHVMAIIQASTRKTFQKTRRRLAAKQNAYCPETLSAALKKAMELDMTYEVANICKTGKGLIASSSLLTRALLATAWGQKKEGSDELFTTASHVDTTLVVAVIKAIPQNLLERVFDRAIRAEPPPNILWALLLAWEQSGSGEVARVTQSKIAHLLIERPHFEQLRYMALASSSSLAVSTLLRANVLKVQRQRVKNNVSPDTVVQAMDLKLFIGGMILMSEKIGSQPSPSTKPLGILIDEIFQSWDCETAQKTIDSLYEYHTPSPQVTMTMIAMLIRHKNYTQAIQVLHAQSTVKMEPRIFYKLLLQVCRDFPAISIPLMTWITNVPRVYLPPSVLQRMVILLSKQRKISDRQSMLGINSVQKLLRGQKASLGPKAAAAIVDGLLERALSKPGGSRNRLQWALDLCKDEGVPQAKVKQWVGIINRMRAENKGYWHK